MIPIAKTFFDEDDLSIIQEPLKSGWVVQGKYVKEFEDKFSAFTGLAYSSACTSCTTALHLMMAAMSIKPGDEVIVPSFTWIATANVVEYMGAKPIFVDIRLDTFNIDETKLEEKITSDTKAIIPVHLFGLMADMDPILEVANLNNILIAEDSACAFDSWYKGKHAGSFGKASAFSFHPRKSITTGEGGMVSTNDKEFDNKVKALRNHGACRSDFDRHNEDYSFLLPEYPYLGYNYRMTDIQGALGISQMAKSKVIMKSRRRVASTYMKKLKNLDWLKLPFQHSDYIHGFQSFVCLFAPEEPSVNNVDKLFDMRNKLMYNLEEKGIITRQGTHSVAHTKYYREKYNFSSKDFPNSLLAEKCSLALPLYAGMTDEEIDTVVENLVAEFDIIR